MPARISVWVTDFGRKFFQAQWVDPRTGKVCTKSTGCTRRREAERWAKEWEDQLNARQTLPADGSMPWADFVVLYGEQHLSGLSKGGADRSLGCLQSFEELAKPRCLADVDSPMMSDYVQQLRAKGRKEATLLVHVKSIAAALRWAQSNSYLTAVPAMPKIPRAMSRRSKGRPLTGLEFRRLLRAVPKVHPASQVDDWRRLLFGLWLSGLRLDEALKLTWDDSGEHSLDVSGRYPLLRIRAEGEKGMADRLLPLTPDFGRWVLRVPAADRTGFVFRIPKIRHKQTRRLDSVSKQISLIGEASAVIVSHTGKFASAHDLRRTFGLRWAQRVAPAELQQLMRHAEISTTMRYYAIMDAQAFAAKLWSGDNLRRESGT